jgi:hypothetical protein
MERQPVSSSSIASVGYDSNTQTLEIKFIKTGKIYQYFNVPDTIHEQMLMGSIGQFFNANIKNVYACAPV